MKNPKEKILYNSLSIAFLGVLSVFFAILSPPIHGLQITVFGLIGIWGIILTIMTLDNTKWLREKLVITLSLLLIGIVGCVDVTLLPKKTKKYKTTLIVKNILDDHKMVFRQKMNKDSVELTPLKLITNPDLVDGQIIEEYGLYKKDRFGTEWLCENILITDTDTLTYNEL